MTITWSDLAFPREVTTEQVTALLRMLASEPRGSLLSQRAPMVVETILSREGVTWRLGSTHLRLTRLQRAADAYLPGLRSTAVQRTDSEASLAVELRVVGPERLLDVDHAEASSRRLLAVAHELRADETVTVQWQIGPWVARSPIPPPAKRPDPTIWNIGQWGAPDRDSEQASAARKKIAEPVFACVGRIAVAGANLDRNRAHHLIASTAGAMQLMRAPGAGISRRAIPSWAARRRLNRYSVPSLGPSCRLTAAELAGLIGWPLGNPRLPGVQYVSSRTLPLDDRVLIPASRQEPSDRVLGVAATPSQAGSLAVLRSADSTRHFHVIGPSGVGKSTLLAHLILADIAAGRSVVVIDPKGDLVTDVLRRIPTQDLDRVAVLDPSDPAPLGFNPLDGGAVGIDGVVHVLRSIWTDSWGPRLGDVLLAGLLTLADSATKDSRHTVTELPLLLTDTTFRRPLVARAVQRDPLGLGTFWPWYESLSPQMLGQVLGPVMSRMRALLLRPDLRAVLGQPEPRFDLNTIFTQRRVLLVRLPKGQLGSDGSQLLGSLLVSHLWRLVQGRAAIPAERRHVVSLYLDEFQEFLRLPVDLPDALVQARGLGLGLTLAHQHLGQLDAPVRAAVLANTGSRAIFRTDFDDAGVLAKRTAGLLSPEDLMGLDAYEAYASIMRDGASTPYGSILTRPLPDTTTSVDRVLRANRDRWGVPRSQTEQRLSSLIDGTPTNAQQAEGPVLGGRQLPEDPP